ncbi:MAG: symmetrical bis(5'-nucleosyl)-tetraphosphatase [Thiohalomonadaceae bacterium]
MSTYAIGDVQGCYDQLEQLLEQIQFDPTKDRLWFVGDLVNRGPKSLQVLRFVRALGDRAITVLGNHDLHLIAAWRQRKRHHHASDTLQPVLDAHDGDELCDWLRQQPLLHHDSNLDWLMVHAGLPPQWDIATAKQLASEVEKALRGDDFIPFLENMYGNQPVHWSEHLHGWERLRFAVNCFTRLRFCYSSGAIDLGHKSMPDNEHTDLLPWFTHPTRHSTEQRIVFGHWSTLGYYRGHNVCAIDTGCLWGGSLTALRLEDTQVYHLNCPTTRVPGD